MPLFEKIVITCPSVLLMAVIIWQLLFLAWHLDYDSNIHGKNERWFERMTGFRVFLPTHAFYFYLWYYLVTLKSKGNITLQNGELSELNELQSSSAPPVSELTNIISSTSNNALGSLNQISEEELLRTPMTPEELAIEVSVNTSLGNQAMMLWPGVWAVSFKISYDTDNEVSWFIVLIPTMVVLCGYMFIGINKKNWTWRDYRFGLDIH